MKLQNLPYVERFVRNDASAHIFWCYEMLEEKEMEEKELEEKEMKVEMELLFFPCHANSAVADHLGPKSEILFFFASAFLVLMSVLIFVVLIVPARSLLGASYFFLFLALEGD